jgi:NAD+ synthase
MFNLSSLKVDTLEISQKIAAFISEEVKNSGLNGAIIAVSGGIDSALTLSLTAEALGPERVRAVTMPERDITPESDITDVMRLTDIYDVTCDVVDITPAIEAMSGALPLYDPSNRLVTGNIRPRIRMIVSYHYANALNMMVIGSSNKTELLTGYFTKYGDGGVDLMPLGDLYKCQVRQLACHMGVPQEIIDKTPTAGLWPGQSDEGEMGASYDTIDLILLGNENNISARDIALGINVDLSLVERILARVEGNEHKRRLPLLLRLGSLTR